MVDVSGVSFAYGSKIVLENISFSVKKGVFFCIAGPNGAGKSTLIKLIARLIKPSEGTVKLNGKNIWDYSRKDFYKSVAVVTQAPSYEFMRVKEFVSLGRLPHFAKFQLFETEKDRKETEKALELCGITKLGNKYITMISGGERQLVFLARALASNPRLLLLDEPLNNLDIAHQQIILDLLMRLREKLNLTIVTVLHDLNVISEFADELVLLKDGQVVAKGKAEEIITDKFITETYSLKDPVIFKNPITSKPFVCICRR